MGIYALNEACTRLYALLAIHAHYHVQHAPGMCYTVLVRMADGHNRLLAGRVFRKFPSPQKI